MRLIKATLGLFFSGLRNGLVALGALALLSVTLAYGDYLATQPGSGTTFASKVISLVHYAAGLVCDATVGETQCAAVDVHGQQLIDVNTSNNNLYAAITAPISAGTAVIGKVGIDQTTPGTTNAVQQIAGTAGGCTPYHLSGGTTASTNANNIKASAGNLCRITAVNTSATLAYLKVYNLATAPTCSSATGIVHVYPIPASATGAGITIGHEVGESYSTGIAFCVTGGGTDTDNTNAPAGVFIEASYK